MIVPKCTKAWLKSKLIEELAMILEHRRFLMWKADPWGVELGVQLVIQQIRHLTFAEHQLNSADDKQWDGIQGMYHLGGVDVGVSLHLLHVKCGSVMCPEYRAEILVVHCFQVLL